MNEPDWLSSSDPGPMLRHLTHEVHRAPDAVGDHPRPVQPSSRKLRLFACSCALLLPDRCLGLRRSVEAALAFADGDLGASGMEVARREASPHAWTVCNPDAGEAARGVIRDDSLTDRRAEMAALLRDVFGNPFRPWAGPKRCHDGGARWSAAADPVWLTPTVTSVARMAYDGRDFAAMPVLADALEEAGCEEETLLRHLRGWDRCPCLGVPCCTLSGDADPRWREAHTCVICRGGGWVPLTGPHVRGCAVLDAVLGKG